VVEAHGLTKRYGPATAVQDLSFTVVPGQVTGFLGPNGSGKSTTMCMIVGLDAPSAGRVTVGGRRHGLNALLVVVSTPTSTPVIAAARLRKGSTNRASGADRFVAATRPLQVATGPGEEPSVVSVNPVDAVLGHGRTPFRTLGTARLRGLGTRSYPTNAQIP